MTDQERNQVLKMIEDGKISPEEGLRLMQALDQVPAEDAVPRRLQRVEAWRRKAGDTSPGRGIRPAGGPAHLHRSNPPSSASGRSRSGSASASPS